MNLAKIYIIDDDPAVLDSLRLLFSTVGYDVEIFGSAHDFLNEVTPETQGCVVLDLQMAEMSGFETMKELDKRGVALPIVIITANGEISQAIEAMRAGAVDFLEKPFDDDALLNCVHRIVSGADQLEERHIADRFKALTKREREVLFALVGGKSNKDIASELRLEPATVERRRAQVMTKMEAHSLADLARMTMRVPESRKALEARSRRSH